VNFETNGAVEVEISRLKGQPIRSAKVHPQQKASACTVHDGKVLVKLAKPCLVAVDIDGQMDEQETGKGYKGPPLHTISIFVNRPIVDKPRPDVPSVFTVKPDEIPPTEGLRSTMYFLPIVHDIVLAYRLSADCNYKIPGDAIVYGTISNTWRQALHVSIYGLGTLSGVRITHPQNVVPAISETEYSRYRPINILGTTDTRVEGITIAAPKALRRPQILRGQAYTAFVICPSRLSHAVVRWWVSPHSAKPMNSWRD
jgi:hypothetical protein